MSSRVVLFGTGDFARVASVYLAEDSPHTVEAFTVHDQYRTSDTLLGKPVVPFERLTELYPPGEVKLFVAVGFKRVNKQRAELVAECKGLGYELISYVCSKATVWGDLSLGDNCFVFENNVIQPFARIGHDTILWSGNHIGHDSTIGDHCFVSSHVVVSGHAKVGDYCFLGVNSTLRDGVTVGAECVIGAGATVLRDVPPGSVVKGTPGELSSVPSSKLKGF